MQLEKIRILVTGGTFDKEYDELRGRLYFRDTHIPEMEVTAQYLGPRIKEKTVVLTGAMIPYAFGSSDGMFNLGSAFAFAQCLPPGVYIAMNGRCFSWDNVQKNRAVGRFEEKVPPK